MDTHSPQSFSFTARHLGLILVLIGIVISAYLSYVEFVDAPIICVEGESFDCNLVQQSAWSKFMGMPVAYLGLAGYLIIGALLLLENRNEFLEDNARLILFAIGLVAWLFSMWLVYVQVAILGAFCQWCLGHEANFTVLFAVIIYLLWRDLSGAEE
jgi:uncharacterized membrane protein